MSACVFVLSAGRTRTIGKWAMVGVHQLNITCTKPPDAVAVDTYLLDAGVSPAIVSYANLADQSVRTSHMFVVRHSCARALRLYG